MAGAMGDSDWQTNLSLLECNQYLWTNGVDSDIVFRVGKKASTRISAHKFILASRSAVFRAMFYGSLAEKGGTMDIPDVEPDIFSTFLEYLYTDRCTLTADKIMALMYTAHKYNVGRLVKECNQFMADSMTTANVCTIMENAHVFSDKDVLKQCREFIEKHSEEIIKSKLLSDLCQECLGVIIGSDDLRAGEEDIYTAVLSWADQRCTERRIALTGTNRRLVLGDVLYLLRFPLMTPDYFASLSECNVGLLTTEEQVPVFRGHIKKDLSKTAFPQHQRKCPEIQICTRFLDKDIKRDYSRWASSNPDLLTVNVSKSIQIEGLVLFGCITQSTTYKVHMEIVELAQMADTTVSSNPTEKTFKVLFPKPVSIEANTDYTLKVSLGNGPNSYFGKYGLPKVTCGGVVFTFNTAGEGANGTNKEQGQIHGLLWREA